MNKQHIINEIIRTAKENKEIPLGKMKFENETGIKECDWRGKYWAKWSDAVKEAGFIPNKLQSAYDQKWLIEQLILLIREIRKFPTDSELRLKAHNAVNFPATNTFERLGTTTKRAAKLISYCSDESDYSDVVEICKNYIASFKEKNNIQETADNQIGFVYLMKSGRYFKVGKSTNVERRNYDIGIKLPENIEIIHKISTDDPAGIEVYWHNRFRDKRKQGEWFDLSSSDIKSFKRRKFM